MTEYEILRDKLAEYARDALEKQVRQAEQAEQRKTGASRLRQGTSKMMMARSLLQQIDDGDRSPTQSRPRSRTEER